MNWDDYCLNDPTLSTPLPVMRGLVYALCERLEAVDSEFHAICTSSGTSAVAEQCLAHILCGESYEYADPREIPFRSIGKEYARDGIWGGYRNLSFMHLFDTLLEYTAAGRSGIMGYEVRQFTDSRGNPIYGSVRNLASALSEPLIAPRSFTRINSFGTVATDDAFQICLNAAWAAQRARMLKLLRYVSVTSGGFMMQCAVSPADLDCFGASPQEAYDLVTSRTISDIRFAGWETSVECRAAYVYVGFEAPERRWMVRSTWELSQILPDHQDCLTTSVGTLEFDAVDLRQRDENEEPIEDGSFTYVFDPLGAAISSGTTTLALSSGVFASWGYGTASGIGGSDTAPGDYIRGWQARNIKVIYDYESTFNFKQGE